MQTVENYELSNSAETYQLNLAIFKQTKFSKIVYRVSERKNIEVRNLKQISKVAHIFVTL